MKLKDIKTPISSIHGIGPQQEKFLAKLNIFTVSDLLSFYPKSYDDRTEKISISDFEKHKKVHAICAVQAHQWFGYGKMKTLKLIINDGTGSASLICFNRNFYEKSLPVGSIICVTGTFEVKFGQIQSTSFEITKLSDSASLSDFKNTPLPDSAVIPVYKLTEGLTQKNIRKAVSNAIFQYAKLLENELPEEIIIKRHLLQKKDAIKAIHNPISLKNAEDARYSLIFEELFNFQSVILERTFKHKGFIPQLSIDYSSESSENNRIKNNFNLNEFEKNLSPLQKKLIERLPFKLTEDQMFAIFQMNNEIDRGYKERSKILSDNISKVSDGSISIDTIQKVVANHYNISLSDIKGVKRNKKIAYSRHIAIYIARILTESSFNEIAAEFGGKDHSTIMHSYNTIELQLKTDESLNSTIDLLIREIKDYKKLWFQWKTIFKYVIILWKK